MRSVLAYQKLRKLAEGLSQELKVENEEFSVHAPQWDNYEYLNWFIEKAQDHNTSSNDLEELYSWVTFGGRMHPRGRADRVPFSIVNRLQLPTLNALAENPSSSAWILINLARMGHGDAVLDNPATSLLALEDPSFLTSVIGWLKPEQVRRHMHRLTHLFGPELGTLYYDRDTFHFHSSGWFWGDNSKPYPSFQAWVKDSFSQDFTWKEFLAQTKEGIEGRLPSWVHRYHAEEKDTGVQVRLRELAERLATLNAFTETAEHALPVLKAAIEKSIAKHANAGRMSHVEIDVELRNHELMVYVTDVGGMGIWNIGNPEKDTSDLLYGRLEDLESAVWYAVTDALQEYNVVEILRNIHMNSPGVTVHVQPEAYEDQGDDWTYKVYKIIKSKDIPPEVFMSWIGKLRILADKGYLTQDQEDRLREGVIENPATQLFFLENPHYGPAIISFLGPRAHELQQVESKFRRLHRLAERLDS